MTSNRKLGIALGSGSARGWAHIGVLKALEELEIRPDVVAGCSAGSLVGVAWACDLLEPFEKWVRDLSWREVVGLMDVTLSGGLVRGEKLMKFFRDNLGDQQIEDLPVQFATVATDMHSGNEIWIREGSMLEAVRASCTYPGLFSPVQREGRWLLDGGIVNPVPVSVCRAMGADIVIAVDLNAHLVGRHSSGKTDRKHADSWVNKIGNMFGGDEPDDAPGIMDVMSSGVNIMQDRITRSRMAGDPPNLLLAPYLHDFSMFDFDRSEEAIAEGRSVVMGARDRLHKLLK
ncbi:patatin-like phospholipase RssA [Endozoicomonadaceae bacterium StTr2]